MKVGAPGQHSGVARPFDTAADLWNELQVSCRSDPEGGIGLHAHAKVGHHDPAYNLLYEVKPMREPLQPLNRPVVFNAFQQSAVVGIARHPDAPVPVHKRIVAIEKIQGADRQTGSIRLRSRRRQLPIILALRCPFFSLSNDQGFRVQYNRGPDALKGWMAAPRKLSTRQQAH